MIKKAVKYAVLVFLHGMFMLVSFFVPKNKKLWVFGAWQGNNYSDNTKYMFEYLNAHYSEGYKYVWITKNDDVFNELSEKGYNVIRMKTFKWFFTLLRASAAFETEGNSDIGGYRPARCKIIQLWHGFGGKSTKWFKKQNPVVMFFKELVFDNRRKCYWMMPSQYAVDAAGRNFFVPKNQCIITGSPRNDIIREAKRSQAIEQLMKSHPDCERIIAYMPTHRLFGQAGYPQLSDEMLGRINEECKKRKILFFFKPHFHEMKYYNALEMKYSNIFIADTKYYPEYADLYSYVGCFDMLISDYSSVIYDYLCSGKPVILYTYDIEEYKITDGVPDAYFENPCGPLCYTLDDVFCQIDSITENDVWVKAREENRVFIHYYDDGKNCERIRDTVLSLIK